MGKATWVLLALLAAGLFSAAHAVPAAPTLTAPASGVSVSEFTPTFQLVGSAHCRMLPPADRDRRGVRERLLRPLREGYLPSVHAGAGGDDLALARAGHGAQWRLGPLVSRLAGEFKPWSEVWHFTVLPTAPTLTKPTNLWTTTDPTPRFLWSAVTNAVLYRLLLSKSSSLSPVVASVCTTSNVCDLPDDWRQLDLPGSDN